MQFEWDEKKYKQNKKDHHIDFETAALVFQDPKIRSKIDRRFDYGEERWISVGLIGYVVIVVVHSFREENGEEICRIISARKATKKEEEQYFHE